MPRPVRRFAPAVVALLGILGLTLSTRLHNGLPDAVPPGKTAGVLDAASFRVSLSRGQIVVSGTTLSSRHENNVRSMIADQFPGHQTNLDFEPGILIGDYWVPATLRMIYVLAATESGTAILRGDVLSIRGTTADPDTLASRLAFLRESLPVEIAVEDDVLVISSDTSLADLCRRMFATLQTQSIAFRQSSADIRTSSFSSLDKIADFAYDCDDASIVITGHSDASGDERWNRRLGMLRAQAVADYLARAGVGADRLVIASKGSTAPIAGNDTPHGRSLNRRIEFELRQPLL